MHWRAFPVYRVSYPDSTSRVAQGNFPQALLESDTSLSTDMAVAAAKKFLRTMAQPFGGRDQEGISTWSLADLERHKEKQEEEKIRELQNGAAGTNGTNGGNDEFGDGEIDDEAMLDLDF